MSYDADVIAEWDAAARSRHRQAHIHPSGQEGADAYAASGADAARHLARLFSLAGLEVSGQRILDYGCGDGRVGLPLADLGAWVYGCDSSPAMLDAFRERRPEGSELAAVAIGPEELPDYAPFDGAYCLAVLIHQRWEAAEEIIGALAVSIRPGGVLVLDAPCYEDEEEGGSAFGVTTFAPARLARIAEELGLRLAQPAVNPGRFAGKPGPVHGAWTVMVAPS